MAARNDPLASGLSNISFSDPCRFCLQFRATLPLWEAEGGHEHTVDFPVALHGCPRLFLWDDVDRRSGREVEVDSEKWMFASNHCGSPLATFSMSDSGNGSRALELAAWKAVHTMTGLTKRCSHLTIQEHMSAFGVDRIQVVLCERSLRGEGGQHLAFVLHITTGELASHLWRGWWRDHRRTTSIQQR